MAGRERESYVGSKGARMTGSHDHEMMCLMKQAGRETCVFTFPGGKPGSQNCKGFTPLTVEFWKSLCVLAVEIECLYQNATDDFQSCV